MGSIPIRMINLMVKKGLLMAKYDLNSTDIYRAVAQQSSLTIPQVRECFLTYSKILEQIADSPNRPKNYRVPIPHVGSINFKRVYSDPNKPIQGSINHVDLSKAHLKEEYDRINCTINKSLRTKVKEISYRRFLKQKEIQNIVEENR